MSSGEVEGHRFEGRRYQARLDAVAATGVDMHGEADLVTGLRPGTVLDAGCGTGRVARELASRGVDVVGADASESMIAQARALAPELTWVHADLGRLDLARVFDVVLMAGNVPLFTVPGTEADLVAGCARHVRPGGALVCGYQLDGRYTIDEYDAHCADVGLALQARYATWDRAPFTPGAGYAVSVHRRG